MAHLLHEDHGVAVDLDAEHEDEEGEGDVGGHRDEGVVADGHEDGEHEGERAAAGHGAVPVDQGAGSGLGAGEGDHGGGGGQLGGGGTAGGGQLSQLSPGLAGGGDPCSGVSCGTAAACALVLQEAGGRAAGRGGGARAW